MNALSEWNSYISRGVTVFIEIIIDICISTKKYNINYTDKYSQTNSSTWIESDIIKQYGLKIL